MWKALAATGTKNPITSNRPATLAKISAAVSHSRQKHHAATSAKTTATTTAVRRDCPFSFASIYLILQRPSLVLAKEGIVLLMQEEIAEHQIVDFGAHEARICLLGTAHHWLAARIEGRVDEDRAAGQPIERRQQVIVKRVIFAAD